MRITDADRWRPLLLHGPVGANRLRSKLSVADEAGHRGGVLAHDGAGDDGSHRQGGVLLADKLDLAKASRYPHIGRVRELAADDMDRAIVEFLRGDIVRLLNMGEPVHPGSLETVNGLLLAMGRR